MYILQSRTDWYNMQRVSSIEQQSCSNSIMTWGKDHPKWDEDSRNARTHEVKKKGNYRIDNSYLILRNSSCDFSSYPQCLKYIYIDMLKRALKCVAKQSSFICTSWGENTEVLNSAWDYLTLIILLWRICGDYNCYDEGSQFSFTWWLSWEKDVVWEIQWGKIHF